MRRRERKNKIVIEVSNVKNCPLFFYIKILLQKRGFLGIM